MDLARSLEHWRDKISADVLSWWKNINDQLPIEEKIRSWLGWVKPIKLPENQFILCQSDSGKLSVLGLSWRNIVMAGKKAGESLARSAQANYYVVYLGQCVGSLRVGIELPEDNEIFAAAIMVARSSSTDDTAFAFSTPEPEKVWVGGIRNRRPVGQELLLNRGAELNAWMEQQKSRFPYIHTDLDLAEVLPFLPQHVISLHLQEVINMTAYTADALVSLPKSTILHNLRTNKSWQWAVALVMAYLIFEVYTIFSEEYNEEKAQKQKALLHASESPELLWVRALENFTRTKIQPSSEILPKLLEAMANLKLNEGGWHLKRISCKGGPPVKGSSPVNSTNKPNNSPSNSNLNSNLDSQQHLNLAARFAKNLSEETILTQTLASKPDVVPQELPGSVWGLGRVAHAQNSNSDAPTLPNSTSNTETKPVADQWAQVWNCEGVYNRETSANSITSEEFLKRIPTGYNLTWEPIHTARLNWQVAIPVNTLEWRRGLLTRSEHILTTSSRLQEMSNYVSNLPSLSFNKLSFPEPVRKDGTKLEKPKFVPELIAIPFKFSYPLVALFDVNQHIPGDWRSFSIGINFNFSANNDVLQTQSTNKSNSFATALTFTLEGFIYGKEQ